MSKNLLRSFYDVENKSRESLDNEHEKQHRRRHTTLGNAVIVVCAIIIVVCVTLCFYYWKEADIVRADAAEKAYYSTKDARAEELRQEYWESGYTDGEKEYHTRNRISIKIEEVREIANLEVMKVSDVVYSIEDAENQAWLKATGTGVYTVNLAAGEYIRDDECQYVLVRVPKPKLTVNLDNAELMFFKDNRFFLNGSISEGEDIARRQRAEAQLKLMEDIESNQTFNQYAENSTITLIKSLVKKFNPKIPELKVDVEFFD